MKRCDVVDSEAVRMNEAYDSLLRDATTKLGSIREWFVDHVEFERTWHDEYMTAEPDELRLLGEILGVFDSE